MADEMKKYTINFVNLRDLVWRDPTITPIGKVVLLDLLYYAGTNGESYPSQKLIADNHGLTARYIRRVLKELKELGWIDWKRGRFGRSNRYSFNKKLYSQTEEQSPMRNSSSYKRGSTIPSRIGNGIPPNISQVNFNQSNSEVVKTTLKTTENESPTNNKSPVCKLCSNGLVTNPTTGEKSFCTCAFGKFKQMVCKKFNKKYF